MKKIILATALILSLTACEEATKKIDEAQQAANEALDGVQQTLDALNFDELNLEQFGEASQKAGELAQIIQQVMEENVNNPDKLLEAQDKVANAYSCLIDASSESTAEKVINTVLEKINNEQATTMIERAIEKASEAKECVM